MHVDTGGADGDASTAQVAGLDPADAAAGGTGRTKAAIDKDKEAKRALAKQAASAHAAFRCSSSDALGALRALCAYEAAEAEEAGGGAAFCAANHMHLRNLRFVWCWCSPLNA